MKPEAEMHNKVHSPSQLLCKSNACSPVSKISRVTPDETRKREKDEIAVSGRDRNREEGMAVMRKYDYKITQWWPFFDLRLRRAARVAYWNTSRTPSPDLAEHSR